MILQRSSNVFRARARARAIYDPGLQPRDLQRVSDRQFLSRVATVFFGVDLTIPASSTNDECGASQVLGEDGSISSDTETEVAQKAVVVKERWQGCRQLCTSPR